MNTYGTTFRVTTYGESHGLAVGAIIDGCPAGLRIDHEAIAAALRRRRGDGPDSTPRREPDEVRWLSGLKEGLTLGTPLAFEIENRDARPADYEALARCCRPGHADRTTLLRYGARDPRGGGRASGRETVARVVAGCIARQLMPGVTFEAHAVPGEARSAQPADTYGGRVLCRIGGVRGGLGDPVFGRLNALLAAAMMSIPSAIGFSMGWEERGHDLGGSEWADQWNPAADGTTLTNHCGGIQGGISNGMPVEFAVAFHAPVTTGKPLQCLDTERPSIVTVSPGGRHDRGHIGRLPVVVESMAALCLVNYYV